MSSQATPSDIRKARGFIIKSGHKPSEISPRHLANASKETGMSLSNTLNFLVRLMSGGQNQGPAPEVTKNVDVLKPENAIGDTPLEYADAPGLVQ